MNLTGQTVSPKPAPPERDPEYLARVHELPCCICQRTGLTQVDPTEAHHASMYRGSQRRTPDSWAIPLCTSHHRRGRAPYLSVQLDRRLWEREYGLDTDYIAATRVALGYEAG